MINSTRRSIKEKVFKRTGHQVDDRKNHKLVHFSRSRALKPWRSSLIEDVPLIPASERGTLESFVDSTTDSAGKNNCRVPWFGRNTRRSRFFRWFCSCNSPDPHSPDSSKVCSICGLARNDKTNSRLPTVTKRRRSVTKSFVELKPTSVQRIWLIRPFRCTQSHKTSHLQVIPRKSRSTTICGSAGRHLIDDRAILKSLDRFSPHQEDSGSGGNRSSFLNRNGWTFSIS